MDDGFGAAIFLFFLAVIAALAGGAYAVKEIKDECDTFGKTKIFSQLYSCERLPL